MAPTLCTIACQFEGQVNGLLDDQPPNILFCLADDASFPHMRAYGTDWVHTPAFDSVAKQGILFMNAYTPNAKCAPSRACILTGRNSWQLEEAVNHWSFFPDKFKTVMEVLVENGYVTGYTGKGWGPGKAGKVNGKSRQLTGKQYNPKTTIPPTNKISKNDYASNFEDFLNERSNNEPFFFWFGAHEPHRPYDYGSSIASGKTLDEVDQVPAYWPDNDTVRTDMLDYAFEIEYFDQQVSSMMQLLEARGELDNTIVIVTSDNGMPFPRAKSHAYEISNHLPLAIMWRRSIKSPGRRLHDFVSFIDFVPTFLEVAGLSLEDTGMEPVTGKSLTDLFYSDEDYRVNPERSYVLIGKERHDVGRPHDWGYPIRGIINDRFCYLINYEPSRWPSGNPETGYMTTAAAPTKSVILNLRRKGIDSSYWDLNFGKRPMEELYDLSNDPDLLENLALNFEYVHVLEGMKEILEKDLRQQGDPRMYGQGHIFDSYEFTDERSVNFYERYMSGDEEVHHGWVNDSDFETNTTTEHQNGF